MACGLGKRSVRHGTWVMVLATTLIVVLALAVAAKPAEAASSISVEAERMDGAGKVFRDRSASRQRAKVFHGNRAASKRVNGSIRYIAVRARGDQCVKPPRMRVVVDGKTVMLRWVKNQKRWGYYRQRVNIPGRSHRVTVKFINDRRTQKCDRNLRVDKTVLHVVAAPRPAPKPVALGVMIDGGSAAGIDRYTNSVGKAPSHVMFFRNWERDAFPVSSLDQVASRGATPIVTWVPKDPSGGVNQPKYALRTIARGDHDAYIRRWARDAKAWGKPFYLRPMHEMNGAWTPWGAGVNGNTAPEFIRAWRHIHRIFEQEGATNVRWVWSPNAGGRTFTDLYPGDAYVDWVALDGYNWGTSSPKHSWRSMNKVFGPSYNTLARMTTKPMMIAETASAEQGGNKAAWIEQSLLRDIPSRFPRVRAVTWFDKDKEVDWRVDSSPGSLAAYKKVAGSNLYQSRLR